MATSQHNLSELGFEDYFRLRYQTEEVNQQRVTDVVSQHDKDKVSYREVYEVILSIVHDLTKAIQEVNDYHENKSSMSLDLTGTLIELLISKGYLSEDEEKDMLARVQKLYKLQADNQEGENQNGNTQNN